MRQGLHELLELRGEVPESDWLAYIGNIDTDIARLGEEPLPAPDRLFRCEKCRAPSITNCGTDTLCSACQGIQTK